MLSLDTPTPIRDAVASLNARTPVAVALSSAQWREVPVQIRQRAFFSANVANKRLLGEMQSRISGALSQAREAVANGDRIFSRANFVKEMQDLGQSLGLSPADPSKVGTLEDITSRKRLELIYDTQVGMAYGYAKWKRDMSDEVGMEFFPAYEFKRTAKRDEPRYWGEHWKAAISALGGPKAAGAAMVPDTNAEYGFQMIALKTSPIWRFISSPKVVSGGLDTDFPPFAFRSGMGVRDVSRKVAEAAGLDVGGQLAADPGEAEPATPQTLEETGDEQQREAAAEAKEAAATVKERAQGSVNEGLQTSVDGLEGEIVRSLEKDFGRRVRRTVSKTGAAALEWVEPLSSSASRNIEVLRRAGEFDGDLRAAIQAALSEARASMTSAIDLDALAYVESAVALPGAENTQNGLMALLAQLVYLLEDLGVIEREEGDS